MQVIAPALRALLSGDDDQVKRFAKLQSADLSAAVEASMESIKQQLGTMHSAVKRATEAKSRLQEDVDRDPTNEKFSTRKAAGGTIDDFFSGLEDRIGQRVGAMCIPRWRSYLTRFVQARRISTSKKRCVRNIQRGAEAPTLSRRATTT